MFYARARMNSLKLEEAMGRGKNFYNKTCKLCKQGVEDLLHFLIECPCLERRRNYEILDRRIQEPKDRLVQCLYRQKRHQETGKMIKEMWYMRRNMLKYEKDSKKENKKINGDTSNRRDNPDPNRIDRGNIRSDPGPKRNNGAMYRESRSASEIRRLRGM